MYAHRVPYVNTNNHNLFVRVANSTIMMHAKVKPSGDYKMITPILLQATMFSVQHQCSRIGAKIVKKLDKFSQHLKLYMDALGIAYLQ